MELSIVILTCNQKEVTARCLSSLKGVAAEIILVDNGSTDGTRDYILEYYPDIKLICNDVNKGVAAGRNLGIKIAKGKYIMLLDNDTIVRQEAIIQLLTYLKNNPDVGLVAPALVDEGGKVQQSFKSYPGILRKIGNMLGFKDLSIMDQAVPYYPFYVIGAAQMFPAEIVDEVGILDEEIFYGPEDADFCMRIRNVGKKVVYLPYVSIYHLWRRATYRNVLSFLGRKHIAALLYFWNKHRRWFR